MSLESYNDGYERLTALIEFYDGSSSKRNEATTRLHLIDVMLKDCLKWEDSSLIAEEPHGREFADYVLKRSRPLAILEAKKEGIYFDLAIGSKRTIYSLKTLCRDNREFKDAIEQVSGYCQSRGVKIGIVSNGWQYVLFIANRIDGVPPLEGNAFVFTSLVDVQESFKTFWNCMSPNGLESGYIEQELLGESSERAPAKLSASIFKYPGIKGRNPFQADMQIISELILEDVIRDEAIEEDFLRECYCQSGALSQYALISKEIIRSRYEFLFEPNDEKVTIEKASNRKGINKDLEEVFSNSLSRRPILLVGDVGVGKSTFINYLIKIEAGQYFEKAITFKLDLGAKLVLTSDVKSSIVEILYQTLNDKHGIDIESNNFIRGVYHREIRHLKEKSIYSDLFKSDNPVAIQKELDLLETKLTSRDEHLRRSLQHISKGHKKQIIIFIDNCDQRSDDDQQTAFLIAQEIAENWDATVFLTLRPETFHNSIRSGALSGYHPKAFTISPPRIDEVISRRLNFALKIARGEKLLSSVSVTGKFENLAKLIIIFQESIQRNKALYTFIDNISIGNTRRAIDLLKNFFGSGHTNTEKALKIFNSQGDYQISVHEFIRSVIYGDNVYYHPGSSPIMNLFDISSRDSKEYFLSPIVLKILLDASTKGKNRGFYNTDKIYGFLQSLGYDLAQIDRAVINLYGGQLIEATERGASFDGESLPSMFRITPKGAYLVEEMIGRFVYVDAMIVDTPIIDDEVRAKISDEENIYSRLNRAKIFVDYLDDVWSHISNKPSIFDWSLFAIRLKKDIEHITSRIDMRRT